MFLFVHMSKCPLSVSRHDRLHSSHQYRARVRAAAVVYAAGQPITNGQGILVQANSGIHTIADLKGRRVGFTKGSSAHNVVVQALEAGVG